MIFFLLLNAACTVAPFKTKERRPASVPTNKPCRELASPFVGAKEGLKSSDLKYIEGLETEWVDRVPELKEFVELNRSPKLKARTRQVFSLLKLKYPEETSLDWVRRYKNLFKEC